jgi:AraC-like DNA-binding protein
VIAVIECAIRGRQSRNRHYPVRSAWLYELELLRATDVAGEPTRRPHELVATLADNLPRAYTETEAHIASDMLKAVAFEAICKRLQRGLTGHAEAFCELERIAAAIDAGPIEKVTFRIRNSQHYSASSVTAAVRIRQFLSAHSTQTLTLRVIAQDVGCSVRSATSCFRGHYKITIFEYLARLRLLHAIRLLLQTDLKLAAIALLVGFRDRVSLHRHFVKRANVTPMAIRHRQVSEAMIYARLALPIPNV